MVMPAKFEPLAFKTSELVDCRIQLIQLCAEAIWLQDSHESRQRSPHGKETKTQQIPHTLEPEN